MDYRDYCKEDIKNTCDMYKSVTDYPEHFIKDVIFNGPATIVIWWDNEKTVVKCGKDDTFDAEKAILMAIAKRLYGGSSKRLQSELMRFEDKISLTNAEHHSVNYKEHKEILKGTRAENAPTPEEMEGIMKVWADIIRIINVSDSSWHITETPDLYNTFIIVNCQPAVHSAISSLFNAIPGNVRGLFCAIRDWEHDYTIISINRFIESYEFLR